MAKTTERKTKSAKTAPKAAGKPVPNEVAKRTVKTAPTTPAKVGATLTAKPSASPASKVQVKTVVKTAAVPLKGATSDASHATVPHAVRTPHSAPTKAAIAKRAYELYLARGATDGHDVQDWIEAERQLRVVS